MLLDSAVTDLDKDCTLYNRSNILPVVDALKKRGTLLYWMVSGAPEHVSSGIVERSHRESAQFLLEVLAAHLAFKITPLQMMKDVIPARSQ
ncbi:MAG: hypothetical protein ABR979_00660 [Halobacteriota archaeon]|jgi:hypothetical protein